MVDPLMDPCASAVASLSDLLQGDLNTGERIGRTLSYVCTLLKADLGVIAPSRFLDIPAFTYGFTADEWMAPRFAFTRALVVRTFESRTATLTSDAQPDHHHDIALSIGLYSILCVPLARRGRTGAVLCLQRRLTTAPFTSDDLELAEMIARWVARRL